MSEDKIDGFASGEVGVGTEKKRVLCCSATAYYTFLLVSINFILFADQNLLAPVLTRIARDFDFVEKFPNGTVKIAFDEVLEKDAPVVDESKRDLFLGGYITLAFFMIGGVASLIAGYLTDVLPRKYTLAAVVVLGETSCLLTYFFSNNYTELLIMRSLTGIAIGGAFPLMFSLFGDLFTVADRGKAIAAAGVAMGAGAGAGQILMSVVAGPEGADWRNAFIIVAVPAYFLVAIMLWTVPEPKRGMKEEAVQEGDGDGDDVADYDESITWEKTMKLFKTPTVVLVFLQGIPASLPWGVVIGFLADFMIQTKEISIAESGTVVLAFGAGSMIGSVLGGWLCDKLKDKKHWIPIIMGTTTAFGAVPMWLLVNLPPLGLLTYLIILLPSGIVIGITGSAVRVVLVNVTLPEVRGTAFSIFNFCDDIGKGLGTFIVAALITGLGRVGGINVAMGGWVIGGLFHIAMSKYINKDYEASQQAIKDARSGVLVAVPVAKAV